MGHDKNRAVLMPSEVSARIGIFDRFAGLASLVASRAAFFTFCVVLVVLWLPTIFLLHDVDTWQLIINTVTTIITFLMVALLQNSQTRADHAIQHKLNAIAEGLSNVMDHFDPGTGDRDLARDFTELRDAVGLEQRESTSGNARQPVGTR